MAMMQLLYKLCIQNRSYSVDAYLAPEYNAAARLAAHYGNIGLHLSYVGNGTGVSACYH